MALSLGGLLWLGGIVQAQPLPDSLIQAEMSEDWKSAIQQYHAILDDDSKRTDIWMRLSDVLARDGQPGAAAQALSRAAELKPADVALQLAASSAWAQADKPREALRHCDRAAVLQPEQIEILQTCAQQANWLGESAATAHYYDRIYTITGADGDLKALARAKGGAGDLDESVLLYHRYFDSHPDDIEARLDYATIQTWRGDYAAAHDALLYYREQRGEDAAWQARMARLLSWANRPSAARPLNDSRLAKAPDDYEHLYTRMLILRAEARHSEAIEALEPLKSLRPESKDTLDAVRSTRAFLRSNVELEGSWRDDADDIRIWQLALNGRKSLTPETYLYGRLGHQELSASHSSPFVGVEGDSNIQVQQGYIGARHRFGPMLELGGHIGTASITGGGGDHGLYALNANTRPIDNLRIDLSATRSVWDISPKSTSMGIMLRDHRAGLQWQPSLRYVVNTELGHGRLSDGNRRNELLINPYRIMLRSENMNLDLGLSGHWQRFDQQLDNGYYDPSRFRRYAFTLGGYWKFSDDDGLSLLVSPGWHKDETLPSYKLGTDISAELYNGIYRDWYSRLRVSYSDRSQITGRYHAYSVSFNITRRF